MKKTIISVLLCLLLIQTQAQDSSPSKWRISLALGQYAAKIGMPSFNPLRIGVQAGASYQFNKSERHQLRQSGYLAGFYHRDLQTAVQLFTEFHYDLHLSKWTVTPLALGGGYVASFSDMPSVKWNGSSYEKVAVDMHNNFLISLGSNLGYETPWKIAQQPLTAFAAYRLQVQGVIVREAVPVMAYSSVQLGLSMPLACKK